VRGCHALGMVGEELVQRWVRRLRQEVPGVVAVFLSGSHVRGDAGPSSDVDFDVLVDEGPRDCCSRSTPPAGGQPARGLAGGAGGRRGTARLPRRPAGLPGAGRPASARRVHAAAARLATGVVALLEAHADTYAPLLSHPRATYLGDGGLRAYVAQLLS
jgi:hypothetical protein